MNLPVLHVAAAILYQDGKYLVTQRCEGDSFGGFWEIPGGKQDPGETLEQTVVREIREELGLTVEVVGFFRTVSYPYPNRTVDLHLFQCRILAGEPQTLECQAYAWVKPEDLKDYRFPDADASLVEELSLKTDWPI